MHSQITLAGISGVLLSISLAYFTSRNIPTPLKELVRKVHDTGNDAGVQVGEERHVGVGTRA